MKNYFIYLLLPFLIIYSCKNKGKNDLNEPIVKVYDKILYKSDILGLLNNNMSKDDSLNVVQSYINSWTQDQLLLHNATEYIKDSQAEIDKKVEEFKNSLIIHKFKEKLIKVNLDSNINNQLIEDYYKTHIDEFKLSSPIVKGFYLKVKISSSEIENFKIIARDSDNKDYDEIVLYINKNNGLFENFTQNWMVLQDLLLKIPIITQNNNINLSKSFYIELTDENYYYFLFISEYVLSGIPAPLEFVRTQINNILLQKEINNIIEEYKQNIYKKATDEGAIKYY
jgi:hypothetical protein